MRRKKPFTGNEALDWVVIIGVAVVYVAFWVVVAREWAGLAIFAAIFIMYWLND